MSAYDHSRCTSGLTAAQSALHDNSILKKSGLL